MIALLDFIEEHREAVAYDLIRVGCRLRDFPNPGLTYGDLAVVIHQSPPESAIARAVEPEQSAWGLSEQLMALVADYLAWLQWAKTEDGSKNRNRPKPIPRPGVESDDEVQKFGADPVALDALDDFLNWSKSEIKRRHNQPRDPKTGRYIKVD